MSILLTISVIKSSWNHKYWTKRVQLEVFTYVEVVSEVVRFAEARAHIGRGSYSHGKSVLLDGLQCSLKAAHVSWRC